MAEAIQINKGALSETEGSIVLRGEVSTDSLRMLRVDRYQREAGTKEELMSLVKALKASQRLPDIELGMRGGNFTERHGTFFLHDPVFKIDGHQRTSAARLWMEMDHDAEPVIGCLVHFNTTLQWEKERFQILNSHRKKVSPNLLLRNSSDVSAAVDNLLSLCTKDKTFVLHDRVSWGQSMKRGELVTAVVMCKTVGYLHSRFGAFRHFGGGVDQIKTALTKVQDMVGPAVLRENVRTFFEILHNAWGVKEVMYRESNPHLKGTFLYTMADLLANHDNFWTDKRLQMDAAWQKKLKLFDLADTEVCRLAGAGGKAKEILYYLLLNHLNSGKRTHRLVARKAKGSAA